MTAAPCGAVCHRCGGAVTPDPEHRGRGTVDKERGASGPETPLPAGFYAGPHAVGVGFEPTVTRATTVFKTVPLGRSGNPPRTPSTRAERVQTTGPGPHREASVPRWPARPRRRPHGGAPAPSGRCRRHPAPAPRPDTPPPARPGAVSPAPARVHAPRPGTGTRDDAHVRGDGDRSAITHRVGVEAGRQGVGTRPRRALVTGPDVSPRGEKARVQRCFRKETVPRKAFLADFGHQCARVYTELNVLIVQNVGNCPS